MIYNLFLEKIILPLGDKLTGSSFMKNLKILREQDNLSEQELEYLQKKKLKKLLEYAVEHSPYYKKYKNKINTDPVKSLKQFPILDKTTLRNETDALLTKNKENLIKQSSSGSSGIQTTVYFNKEEQSIQRAYQIRWWEWAGYKIGDPLVQTGMNPKRGFIKSIKDVLFYTKYFKAFTYNEDEVDEVLQWSSKQQEVSLAGYASSLYVLSKIAYKKEMNISFKTIIVWGDKLFDHYRKSLEDIFQSKVYETYAASEGLMIAAQKDLPYMYLMSLNVFVEFLDDNGNEVMDGEIGHVVVTKLDGYAMPLIRYRIGDLAIRLPRDSYPPHKDLPYPLLQKVVGRDTDIVKTLSGQFMVVHTFTGIFEYFPEIEQFCVLQKDLKGIIIEYIPRESFTMNILSNIEQKIRNTLNEETFYIQFVEVDHIAPTASGKPQIIQSFLDKADLRK